MYKSFRVKNYRCFKNLAVEPLDRVNLIAGKNNVGKTALLEALFLHHQYDDPQSAHLANAVRGLHRFRYGESLWELFPNYDRSSVIELAVQDSTDRRDEVEIMLNPIQSPPPSLQMGERDAKLTDAQRTSTAAAAYLSQPIASELLFRRRHSGREVSEYSAEISPNGEIRNRHPLALRPIRAILIPALTLFSVEVVSEYLSDLLVVKRHGPIIEALQIVEPRLKELEILQYGGGPVIAADIGLPRVMPIQLLGDGTFRLLTMSVFLAKARNGMLLIDEFENGFHYSVLKNVWKALASLAREVNAQVVATTHSHECIQAAHDAFCESPDYDFRLHRLDRIEDTIKSVTYDREGLEFSLEAGWEVR